jgi:ribosome-associated protein
LDILAYALCWVKYSQGLRHNQVSVQLSFRFIRIMTTSDNTIKLDSFLKLVGVAPTGGQAKLMIQNGDVLVNGMIETRRGRKLLSGDRVTVGGQTFDVQLNNS